MQKRATRARTDKRRFARLIVGLALAGSGAGGATVGTSIACHGEGSALVETTLARHGPRGTAARLSADLSDEWSLAVTITVSGNCRTASSIILKTGRGAGATGALPLHPKRVA